MKLRNKDTMEIREAEAREDGIYLYDRVSDHWWKYELELLAKCWEYYIEPKEPLIKDEKIRKAVRAWAEANDYGNDEVYEFEDFWTSWRSWSLEHRGDDNEIHFNGGIDFDKMNHRGTYTIAELCGEEEE